MAGKEIKCQENLLIDIAGIRLWMSLKVFWRRLFEVNEMEHLTGIDGKLKDWFVEKDGLLFIAWRLMSFDEKKGDEYGKT